MRCGEVLFEEGAKVESFYVCESGCVRLEVLPNRDKPIVLYRAKANEAFAEEHLILDAYSYRGVIDEDSVLLSAPKTAILNDIRSDPIIGQRYIYCLSQRNLQLRVNFERLSIKSAKERVFHFLKTKESLNPGPQDFSGKLKSYSDDLNLTHEAMYRALKDLEEEGRICRNDGIVEIIKNSVV